MNAKYGMPNQKQADTYEAWLAWQPTRDLREILQDPETDAEEADFIRQVLNSRRSPQS